jgi:arylsulfatase A-like enzyme
VRDWYRDNKRVKEAGYVTTLLGQDASRLIDRHDPSKPLFLYLAFTAPHSPYQAPQNYLDHYRNIADPSRRAYAAMITAMDDEIGRVVQSLEKRGMRENTLIIFHSDNGGTRSALFAGEGTAKGEVPPDNGPYRDGKGSLYEGGTRVVSLINWPGRIKPGAVVDQMMHVVDYYPTLTGLAGATVTKSKPLDGLDMWPTLSEGKPSPRDEVVYNVELFRGAVRKGDWKLLWRATLPPKLELFNLAQDPSEKNDLAQQQPEEVRERQQRIEELSAGMSKSLFLADTFRTFQSRPGQAPAFPNEDAYYEGDTP